MTPKNIEQASPDVREVLFKAAMQLGQYWPSEKRMIFRRFLDAEAYTDAALMLVPEGCGFVIMGTAAKVGRDISCEPTISLSIASASVKASLRAKGPGQ